MSERRYTLREALRVLADALADHLESRGHVKPAAVSPKPVKRPRAPRRAPAGAGALASEADREAARKVLRRIGVRLPESS